MRSERAHLKQCRKPGPGFYYHSDNEKAIRDISDGLFEKLAPRLGRISQLLLFPSRCAGAYAVRLWHTFGPI